MSILIQILITSSTLLEGKITHQDFKNWNLDMDFKSEKLIY